MASLEEIYVTSTYMYINIKQIHDFHTSHVHPSLMYSRSVDFFREEAHTVIDIAWHKFSHTVSFFRKEARSDRHILSQILARCELFP